MDLYKPEEILHICLDPQDLSKTIMHEYDKPPTLDEISHKLSMVKIL